MAQATDADRRADRKARKERERKTRSSQPIVPEDRMESGSGSDMDMVSIRGGSPAPSILSLASTRFGAPPSVVSDGYDTDRTIGSIGTESDQKEKKKEKS